MKSLLPYLFISLCLFFLPVIGGAEPEKPEAPKTPPGLTGYADRYSELKVDTFPMSPSGRVYGWSTGEMMLSRLLMYEASGRKDYLETFITEADKLLALRDSERGLTDYRGLSLPAWLTEDTYLGRFAALKDEQGRPSVTFITPESTRWDYEAGFVRIEHSGPAGFHLILEPVRQGRVVSEGVRRWDNLIMPGAEKTEGLTPLDEAFAWGSGRPHLQYQAADMSRAGPAGQRRPAEGRYPLKQGRLDRISNTGTLSFPLARFARLVMQSEELSAIERYHRRAEVYLQAARAAVAVHEDEWVEGPDGRGWYISRPGAPQWLQGGDVPVNRYHTLAMTMMEIDRAAGEPGMRRKVEAMARTFRDGLTFHPEAGAYTWDYWKSGTEAGKKYTPRPEDISHAGVNAMFVWFCYDSGIVFNQQDIERMANTWLNIIRREEGIAERVDGTGEINSSRVWRQWRFAFPGADVPRLHQVIRQWYLAHQQEAVNSNSRMKQRHTKIAWAVLAWAEAAAESGK